MITLQNISFGYTRKKPLFSNLTLDISKGNIHGLLGKNGAGKTTLLKLIAGLRKPDSGFAQSLGFIPNQRSTGFLSQLYFVPEELYVPSMKAKHYIDLYAKFYPDFSSSVYEKCLSDFELDTDIHLGRLSLGQKKKFALSFALASGAKLVLLDEPTNGLDIPSKGIFRKLVASALSDERCFVISTHQVRDLNLLIDKVSIIDKGQIIVNSSIQDISAAFTFQNLTKGEEPADIVYFEDHVEGRKAILKNNGLTETDVDIEMLFNAAVKGVINIEQQ